MLPSSLLVPPNGKATTLADAFHPSIPQADVPTELRWLLTEAHDIIGAAGDLGAERSWEVRYGREHSRALRELVALRERAGTKFSRANEMFFTRRSLEQATDATIAIYKGQRFAPFRHVLDLCSGIGGDAIGIALSAQTSSSRLSLVDRDAGLCACAAANLSAHGIAADRLQWAIADALSIDWQVADAWHIDPDRRTAERRLGGERRHTKVDAYLPALADVLEQAHGTLGGGIKLAPAAELVPTVAEHMEREWIGHRRECQQQMAWIGELASGKGLHRATVLDGGETTSFAGVPSPPVETTDLKRFVFEPHPTVLAASLESTWARAHDLTAIAASVMYFTSDDQRTVPLSASFEVLDSLPYRTKAIRKWLKTHDARITEVKKRHVSLDPSEVLRSLRGEGALALSLLLFRRGPAIRAILAKRVR